MASEGHYQELEQSLQELPFISPAQVNQWVNLQRVIDRSRDFLIRAVPEAAQNIDEAQRILAQRTYTLVFFGGTGVGKSTLINALLGRNLLPTGPVTAVTGTIVYIEQAEEGEPESLTLEYWSKEEFANRVRRLCQLAEMEGFDITNKGERAGARADIEAILEGNREEAKTERDEYLEILVDCLNTYENFQDLFKAGTPPPQVFALDDPEALAHLREDSNRGSAERQIRIVRSATFKIHPPAGVDNLLMNGHLRIVDVPGLGAGMRLHEAITLEEMKREDAMIVLVTDAGRQRVDEMKSLAAVNWVKEKRLFGLSGGALDEAAAKVFLAVNGANVRQAFDRLNAGLPESDAEIKAVTRHIAPNYWERYRGRGHNRPYFLVMAPSALYVQDPDHAPEEFASETERILKVFGDQFGNVDLEDPLDPDTKEALLELSEVPLLRRRLIEFIQKERVPSQLREAGNRVRGALQSLRFYYEKQLSTRGVQPPFGANWETLQERRYENLLARLQKELPRAFHTALLEMSARTNSDDDFRHLLNQTLDGIQHLVEDAIEREVETLLESYGTEYWDDRDVTYDNLVWGTSGIEVPIKRILFQVELTLQESLAQAMPQVGNVVADELERTLDANEMKQRLLRAGYEQPYQYLLPQMEALSLEEAYDALIRRVRENYRQICQRATMYELVTPERSVHHRLEQGERALGWPSNERLLDVALHGVESVRQEMAADQRSRPPVVSQESEPEDDVRINILEEPVDFDINLLGQEGSHLELERSYAEKLDEIAAKTNRVFRNVVSELFCDDELMARLRRLFWLETTRAERDFNNHIVKPMIRQHDRNLSDESLRRAMEPDLESISEVEEMMRVWEGLDRLEGSLVA